MQASEELSEFGKILLFMLLGIYFILIGMAINALLKKRNPNAIKNSTYECGEVTEGPSRTPFNMRFYIIAIIFLLFDVELIFLFPWSTIFADKNLLATIPHWMDPWPHPSLKIPETNNNAIVAVIDCRVTQPCIVLESVWLLRLIPNSRSNGYTVFD